MPSVTTTAKSSSRLKTVLCSLPVVLAACAAAPSAMSAPLQGRAAMVREYRSWLDHGRTPARAIDFVRKHGPDWRVIDLLTEEPRPTKPGDRLLFVWHDRSVLLVVVGEKPLLRGGARLIAAHIDTPSPELDLGHLSAATQLRVRARTYGGMRMHHWLHLPLAVVGEVVAGGGKKVDVSLGLDDDFALYASETKARGRELLVTTGTNSPDGNRGKADTEKRTARTLMSELNRRYGLAADDLQAAELYLVPKHRARDVGLDRSMIGAHGQDDRINSYVAWRAIFDLPKTPPQTAVTWLVDREEAGSIHAAGAASSFLELAFAYLLRAQGTAATEANLTRMFAASRCLSADTPAGRNPNWPEVLEDRHAPILGRGAVLFPYTGRGGKQGGSAAGAELIRSVIDSFKRARVPLQYGLLGRVDEGGGGTVAKYLARRGIAVVDVGIALVSMHSPLEISAKEDLWTAYRGFRAWLVSPTTGENHNGQSDSGRNP